MSEIMSVGDIAFPHLGIYLRNVPKSFTVFGFTIALYGVIIATGMLLGVCMASHEAKRTKQDPDAYWDFALYAIIISIIGARAYFVIFKWEDYKDNLLNIFNLRLGGLAIYGAVIAAFITLFVYTRIHKYNVRLWADTGVQGLILGQIIGRWGNFTNREAFGQFSDGLLAMRLPIEAVRSNDISQALMEHVADGVTYIQVHPTFLYESLWNLGVFALMMLYKKHKKFDGEVTLLYLGGYGLGRAWIEGLRTDQLLIPNTGMAVSQLLAIALVVFAVVVDLAVRTHMKKTIKESEEQ
ncbi:MAG: prolipoprotein diacylglyceryl transferase [Lachnospiraceae bacterium]|nr:prolipoprotein diacylglyceryl transferase [Lachnospiraceae bacterium]